MLRRIREALSVGSVGLERGDEAPVAHEVVSGAGLGAGSSPSTRAAAVSAAEAPPVALAEACWSAQVLLQEGRVDEAIAAFTAVIVDNPDKTYAFSARGFAYVRRNQFDEAYADFRHLEEAAAGDFSMLSLCVTGYEHSQRYAEALRLCQLLLERPRCPTRYALRSKHIELSALQLASLESALEAGVRAQAAAEAAARERTRVLEAELADRVAQVMALEQQLGALQAAALEPGAVEPMAVGSPSSPLAFQTFTLTDLLAKATRDPSALLLADPTAPTTVFDAVCASPGSSASQATATDPCASPDSSVVQETSMDACCSPASAVAPAAVGVGHDTDDSAPPVASAPNAPVPAPAPPVGGGQGGRSLGRSRRLAVQPEHSESEEEDGLAPVPVGSHAGCQQASTVHCGRVAAAPPTTVLGVLDSDWVQIGEAGEDGEANSDRHADTRCSGPGMPVLRLAPHAASGGGWQGSAPAATSATSAAPVVIAFGGWSVRLPLSLPLPWSSGVTPGSMPPSRSTPP